MASKSKYNPDDVERWITVRGARIPIMKDGSFGVGETASGDKVVVKQDDLVDKKKIERKSLEDKYKQEYDDFWADDFARTYLRSDTDEELNETERNLQRDLSAGQMSVRAKYETMGMIQAINIERKRRQEKAKTTSRNAKYDTSRATKKNGATKEDIERDKETFRKAREHEQKVAQRKATGRQMVANARDAIKKYGPKRGMWEDFNAADKVWTSISKAYSSGEISREDYEKAYNIFGARFFEMRKTRNRKK